MDQHNGTGVRPKTTRFVNIVKCNGQYVIPRFHKTHEGAVASKHLFEENDVVLAGVEIEVDERRIL